MKPAPFRYIAAHSLEEALAAKAEHGEDARFLAGGQSLVPAMNFRLVQPAVLRDLPLITEALPEIAHPQIRNRGTIGGSLANADPASELPAIVRALGGRLRARSAISERIIKSADFFVGAL